MPKAAAGTAKALSNAMKAKGLTKLRFYCQICEKANRDENGYKCHLESESHLRKAAALGTGSGKAGGGGVIDDFSREFQDAFVALLSRRFGTRRIKANRVYQEYIQERHHLHMNATRWLSLTEFVKHLGREGIVHVDETEEGWFISWIDNSPGALARQDALQRMNRQKMNDEQRERKLLQQQIERAAAAEREQQQQQQQQQQGLGQEVEEGARAEGLSGGADDNAEGRPAADPNLTSSAAPPPTGLLERGPDAAPLKLGISLRTSASGDASSSSPPTASSAAPGTSASATGKQFALAKPAALKNAFRVSSTSSASRPALPAVNAFKKAASAQSSSSSSTSSSTQPSSSPTPSSRPHHQLTAAERLREEELERKRRMVGPQPSAKRMRL